ncbi:MAG: C-GCAxxG-C-C family protein [Clostridiales bacterium]|nr:C-GCAxxG-C-C family protein [Clostridiales bacterium]
MESRVEQVLECFNNAECFNCAQAMLTTYCEDLGLTKETALKLACGFGAGMGRLGHTCGAVTGAYMVIGLKHGHFVQEQLERREKTYALIQEFEKRFAEKNRTTVCRELVQADFLHDDKTLFMEKVQKICPELLKDAVGILEDLLFAEK